MPLTEAQQFVLGKVHPRVKFLVGNKTDIPKILLIKLGAVGELVMASPFFDQLRKQYRKDNPRRQFNNQRIACHNSQQFEQF